MKRRVIVGRRGFTMLEMMLAMALMAILMVLVFMTFNTMINSWIRTTAYIDRQQHADFALNQIISGLRSAYYPSDKQDEKYGFMLIDGGDGEDVKSSDMIQWTKLGSAIVGSSSTLGETAHKVNVWVRSEDGDEPAGLWVRAWRDDMQLDDFDPEDEKYVAPYLLVKDVQGFNCRVIGKPEEMFNANNKHLDWKDEWTTSNTIPYMVELTFTMKPVEEGDDPVVFRRRVELPLWDVSQNSLEDKKNNDPSRGGRSGTSGGNNRNPTVNMDSSRPGNPGLRGPGGFGGGPGAGGPPGGM